MNSNVPGLSGTPSSTAWMKVSGTGQYANSDACRKLYVDPRPLPISDLRVEPVAAVLWVMMLLLANTIFSDESLTVSDLMASGTDPCICRNMR